MNYKKKKIKAVHIVLIIVAVIILLTFSFVIKDKRNITVVEKVFKDIGSTILNVASAPANFIGDKIEKNKEMKNVYNNYKSLSENVETIDLIKAENESLKKEIKKLKELQEIKEPTTEYTYITATVIKRNVGYWNNSITINKGSSSGLKEGMAVIDNGGMIGVLENVAYHSSDVKLITSPEITPKLSVEVKDSEKISPGLLSKYDEATNTFIIEGISEYKSIDTGSYIYTTSYNENIPAGILVGKVIAVKKDNYDLSKIIDMASNVDFNNIRHVKIIIKGESNDK